VGHAAEVAYLKAAENALVTLSRSDLWALAEPRVISLVNGMGAGPMVARAEEVLGTFGHVLIAPQNIGIPAGRNRILREAMAQDVPNRVPDYVLEIHNDHIFPAFWFKGLLAAMEEHQDLGAVGPGLLTPDANFGGPRLRVPRMLDDAEVLQRAVSQRAAEAMNEYAGRRPRLRRGLSHPVLKRLAAMEKAGPEYDEGFHMADFEDTDEARRLEHAGYRVCVCLISWVFHFYHFSRLAIVREPTYARNLRHFSNKWADANGPEASSWLERWNHDLSLMYE